MPLNRVVKPLPRGVIAQRGLYEVNRLLRKKLAALQTHVDEEGVRWANGIASSIYSMQSAAAAAETYDRRWFAKSLWSKNVKARIARSLIDACSPYPTIDTSLWQKIVRSAS